MQHPSLYNHNHTILTLSHPATDQSTRRHVLYSLLHSLSPSDLLFVSQTISPLLKRDFLSDLPAELALYILSFVEDPRTLCTAMRVSRNWYAVVRDENVWKRLCSSFRFPGIALRQMEHDQNDREPIAPPPLVSFPSNSSNSSVASASTSSMPFCWRRYFKNSYIISANWRHGGSLLVSHRLPVSSSHLVLNPTPFTPLFDNCTVTSLALDNDYVVVGLANSNIKVFSARTGVLTRTLTGHESGVWGVCLISKGGWLEPRKRKRRTHQGLAGSLTKEMKRALDLDEDEGPEMINDENLGEAETFGSGAKQEKTYEPGRPSFMTYSSIGWGQPNSIVVSGGCDKDLKVWDAKSGQCIYSLPGHTSTIRTLKTLHNTPIAVSGSRDATLRVWDVQEGLCLQVLEGHSQSVRCIDVCGRRVVSGSYDNTCRIWDIDTGECLHVLVGHFHQIYSVAFDGVHVASGGLDTTVRVWDASNGACIALLQGHNGLVCQLQLSTTSTTSSILVTGGSDGRVIAFSLETFLPVYRIAAHEQSVTALQFDEEFLVTGGKDGRVRLWDVKSGKWVRDVGECAESVWKVGFGGGDVRARGLERGVGSGREVLGVMCKRNGKTVIEIWSLRPREHGRVRKEREKLRDVTQVQVGKSEYII